jgi:hypothetical protein
VIALYAENDFDRESVFSPAKESVAVKLKSAIQFWRVRKAGPEIGAPEFGLAVAHDFGRVRSLQWCPSGGQSAAAGDQLPRLGILAAGCEDGTVRIFPVPELESLPAKASGRPVFRCHGAVLTLLRPDGAEVNGCVAPCVKVWFVLPNLDPKSFWHNLLFHHFGSVLTNTLLNIIGVNFFFPTKVRKSVA